jgi:hypothetical protein
MVKSNHSVKLQHARTFSFQDKQEPEQTAIAKIRENSIKKDNWNLFVGSPRY